MPTTSETISAEICVGESYDFHGQQLTSSGVYNATVVGSNGCDSVVTLQFTVHPTQSTFLSAEICEGSVYDFHGVALDSTGTYVDTLSTAHGCDSIVSLNLTVYPTYAETQVAQICEGSTHNFHGVALDSSGTYVDTLSTVNGCDSVVTLTLTVLDVLEEMITDTICAGEVYDFNGQQVSSSGTYSYTTTSSIGCDSVVTLDLTVLPTTSETISAEICVGESYDFHGQQLTTSGVYNATVVGSNGCDSVVTLQFTVHPTQSTFLSAEICEGSTYDFHGVALDSTGTYIDTLSTAHGCDSIVSLNLTVYPTYAETQVAQICEGSTHNFHGVALDSSGIYVDTLSTVHGCDSVVTLTLTVLDVLEEMLADTICAGEVYDFNGQQISSSGSYSHTTTSSIGCDSIVTLDLTVLPTTSETISAEICVGESYDFHGQQLTTSGVYHATVVGSNGCDSVVTLQFTVHPTQSTFLSAEICEGSTHDFHGVALDSTGTYIDTLSTVNGCDSIVSLDLTVYPTYAETQVAQICEGSTHDFHGVALDSSGIYVDTLSTVNGCDSVVTLTLTVLDVLEEMIADTICAGEVSDFNGQQMSSSGTYSYTTTSSIGCDSVVTLDLTVLPTTSETISAEICVGESYDFHGQQLTTSGVYNATLVGSNGCDSVVTLQFTVHPTQSTFLSAEICEGSTYDFHGVALDSTGTYVDTLSTAHGCDSIVSLNLTVYPTYAETQVAQICEGSTHNFHGVALDSSGTYVDTLSTINGCDSVVTLTLTVLDVLEETITDTICAGEVYDFNGQQMSSSGSYSHTTTSSIGCDSVVTLDLTVLPTTSETISAEICVGESYDFHGQQLTTSGVYNATVVGRNGCDSVVTLQFTVHPTQSTFLSAEICEGSTYDFHGVALDSTGSYVDTLSTVNGCDSIVSLNLTVYPTYTETQVAQICEGSTHDFHGVALDSSGIYVDTLSTVHGCDSVITLTLTVLDVLEEMIADTICAGEVYDFNGQQMTSSGSYSHTTTSSIGCDSVVTLDLTVLPTTSETISAEICVGESYDFHGQSLTTSGVYNATVVGSNGCDSVVTLQFTVHPTQSTFLSAEICEGSTYDFHGVALDSAGTYVDTLSTAHGCDSIVSLNLTVYPTYTETQVAQICEGSTHDFHGVALASSGTYVDTLSTVNGCDSVVTLTLTVLDILEETIADTICAGEVYDFNGQQVSSSGSYSYTTTSSIGCDSILTLDLTVLPTTSETISAEICADDIYNFHGAVLSVAGTYVDTLQASNGCDSIVTLELFVNPVEATTMVEGICAGEVYDFLGTTLDGSGVYYDTLQTAQGCDLLVTLDLTVYPSYSSVSDAQICDGLAYDFHGKQLTSAGTYTDTLSTVLGCDSIVTLHLTVLEILEETISDSICANEEYHFNGQVLKASGTYRHTTTSSIGCDSIVTLELTVLPVQTALVEVEICSGESYDFNGQSINVAGTYVDTLTATNGCDSIVTLELTVNPVLSSTMQIEICQGDSFDFHGLTLETAGTYLDTLSSNSGCDSMVTLELVVHPTYLLMETRTRCEGSSYDFHGRLLDQTGTYLDTLKTIQGCDSVVVLELTVLPILRDTIVAQICTGDSYDFHGQSVSSEGSYADTLVSSIGCDSVVVLNLSLLDVHHTDVFAEICDGEVYDFLGTDLMAGGVYVDTLTNALGCDSVINLTLTVHPVYQTELDYSICVGDSIDIAGKTYREAGTFSDTLSSVQGCDSVLLITVELREVQYERIHATICNAETFDFHGRMLDSAGMYSDTLTGSNGCDSIVMLDLEVRAVTGSVLDVQVCIGQTYNFLGTPISTTGTYSDTLTNVAGCDSIVTLNFSVVETIEVDIRETICEFESTVINGVSYHEAGHYRDTLTAVGGCDSVLHIEILVAPIEYTTLSVSICESDTFDFHGVPLTLAGTYVDTLSTAFGCDSILTLDLSVTPTLHTTLVESICEGESFMVGDTSFAISGSYVVTVPSTQTGCDSVIQLDLTVIPTAVDTTHIAICETESYTFNGVAYNTTGIFTDTLTSAAGCDSLSILDLVVHPLQFSTVMYSICTGDEAVIDGVSYDSDTTFQSIYAGAQGCDSTVTYEVTVLPDVTLSVTDEEVCPGESVQLSVAVSGAGNPTVSWEPASGLSCADCLEPIVTPDSTTTYKVSTLGCGGSIEQAFVTVTVVPLAGMTVSEDQTIDLGEAVTVSAINEQITIPINWYDGTTGELLCSDCPNLTQRPSAPGTYYYRAEAVNPLGCGEEDTVTVTVIDPCEIEQIEAANAFTPNGDGYNDYFEVRNDGVSNITLVEVFNRWGEKVFEESRTGILWDGTFRGEPVNPGVYMYIIRGVCQNDSDFILSGNVTVIR